MTRIYTPGPDPDEHYCDLPKIEYPAPYGAIEQCDECGQFWVLADDEWGPGWRTPWPWPLDWKVHKRIREWM